MKKLRTFDVFSGIGGMSRALSDICCTVAYCEIQAGCRDVLLCNIRKGLLKDAPIFHDIRLVTGSMLPHNIQMITAGFPCQDLSSAGNQLGMKGSRTSLFHHIVRLAAEMPSVSVIFMENSSLILKNGIDVVVSSLIKLGFKISYTCIQANEVGAPHRRRRWYAVATRNCNALPRLVSRAKHNWDQQPAPLMRKSADQQGRPWIPNAMYERYSMIGNAIVPQCAALAWNELTKVREVSASYENPVITALDVVTHIDKSCKKTCERNVIFTAKPLQIVISTANGVSKRSLWATPTSTPGRNKQYRTLNGPRALNNLFNQLFYAQHIQEKYNKSKAVLASELSKFYYLNPVWLEWLMGYPSNWTRIDTKCACIAPSLLK